MQQSDRPVLRRLDIAHAILSRNDPDAELVYMDVPFAELSAEEVQLQEALEREYAIRKHNREVMMKIERKKREAQIVKRTWNNHKRYLKYIEDTDWAFKTETVDYTLHRPDMFEEIRN